MTSFDWSRITEATSPVSGFPLAGAGGGGRDSLFPGGTAAIGGTLSTAWALDPAATMSTPPGRVAASGVTGSFRENLPGVIGPSPASTRAGSSAMPSSSPSARHYENSGRCQPIFAQALRADLPACDIPPLGPSTILDLNYPPPNYFLLAGPDAGTTGLVDPAGFYPAQSPLPLVDTVGASGGPWWPVAHPPAMGPQQRLRISASVDDLLGLVEEFWTGDDDRSTTSPFECAAPPPLPTRHVGGESPECPASGSGSASARSPQRPATPAGSVHGDAARSPPLEEGRSSPWAEGDGPAQPVVRPAGVTFPDVVTDMDSLKSLLTAPHVPHRPLALLAHRIGPTLLLEGCEGPHGASSAEAARTSALLTKLRYYSVLMSTPTDVPGKGAGQEGRGKGREGSPFRRAIQWRFGDLNVLLGIAAPTFRDPATGADANMHLYACQQTVATDRYQQQAPAPTPPSAAADAVTSAANPSVRNHKLPKSPQKAKRRISDELEGESNTAGGRSRSSHDGGGLPPPQLDHDSALDFWLQGVMSGVSQAALCYHDDGVVQGFQVVPTHTLPTLANPTFSPLAVQTTACNILTWLRSATATGGNTFVVLKEKDSTALRLYDVSNAATPGPRSTAMRADPRGAKQHAPRDGPQPNRALVVRETGTRPPHRLLLDGVDETTPPRRRLRDAATSLVFPHRRGGEPLGSPSGVGVGAWALVPVTQAQPARAQGDASGSFRALHFPLAMMCYRMAQCLPTSDAEALRLWQRVIALLSMRDELSLLPLAVAHTACMEHFHSSSPLPDADRQAVAHCNWAIECLYELHHAIRTRVVAAAYPDDCPHESDLLGPDHEEGPTYRRVSPHRLAELMDAAMREDGALRGVVNEMRRLCVLLVKCMCAMALQQLRDPAPTAATIGRALEHLQLAQDALALRAYEVPSGLILAAPDAADPSASAASTASIVSNGGALIVPYSQRFDTIASFELVCSVAAETAVAHLHRLRAMAAEATVSAEPAPSSPLGRYMDKLHREVKITHAVMQTNQRLEAADIPPDHVNFIARLTPFQADAEHASEVAVALLHQALAYNNVLFNGRGEARRALLRKVAGVSAVMGDIYARGLVRCLRLSPGAGEHAMALTRCQQAELLEKARLAFEGAASKFGGQCQDEVNFSANMSNAAKMVLRGVAEQLAQHAEKANTSASGSTVKMTHHSPPILEQYCHAGSLLLQAVRDPLPSSAHQQASPDVHLVHRAEDRALEEVMGFAYLALVKMAEAIIGSASSAAAVCVEERGDFPLSAEQEDRVFKCFLDPALKLPRRLLSAGIINAAEQRAMEVRARGLVAKLHYLCAAVPDVAHRQSSPSEVKPSQPSHRRTQSARHAKSALRHLLSSMATALSPQRGSGNSAASDGLVSGSSIGLPLWLEYADGLRKVLALDLFLGGDSSTSGEHVDALERIITSVCEWRPWVELLASERVIQGGQEGTPPAGAGTNAPPSISASCILEATEPILRVFVQTLLGLSRLLQQQQQPQGSDGGRTQLLDAVQGAVRIVLSALKSLKDAPPATAAIPSATGKGKASAHAASKKRSTAGSSSQRAPSSAVSAAANEVVKAIDAVEHAFRGRRRRQQ